MQLRRWLDISTADSLGGVEWGVGGDPGARSQAARRGNADLLGRKQVGPRLEEGKTTFLNGAKLIKGERVTTAGDSLYGGHKWFYLQL